jgi:hypothetical protein
MKFLLYGIIAVVAVVALLLFSARGKGYETDAERQQCAMARASADSATLEPVLCKKRSQ